MEGLNYIIDTLWDILINSEYTPYILSVLFIIFILISNHRKYLILVDVFVISIYTIFKYDIFNLTYENKWIMILSILRIIGIVAIPISLIKNLNSKKNCTQSVFAECTNISEEKTNYNDDDGTYIRKINIKYRYKFNDVYYYFEENKDIQGNGEYSEVSYYDEDEIRRSSKTIKINPRNPKEYRLKNDGFTYNFIAFCGLVDIILSSMFINLFK